MFICDSCLSEHFTNDPRWFRSNGRCEVCAQTAECSDIQSASLILRSGPAEMAPELDCRQARATELP